MTHHLNPRTGRLWAVLLTLTLALTLLVPACAFSASFTLPASLTRIEAEAFRANQALVDVVFPSGLTYIGEYAFADCANLKSISLPASLKQIDKEAFSANTSLVDVVLPEGLTRVDERAFANCKNLRRVTLPSTLTSLAANAFEGCPPIQFITSGKPSDAVQAVLDAQVAKLPQSAHPAVSGTWTYTGNSAATHLTVQLGKVELAPEHTLTLTLSSGKSVSLSNVDAYQPITVEGNRFTLKLVCDSSVSTPCYGFEVASVTPRYKEDATLKLAPLSNPVSLKRECKLTAEVTGTLTNPSYTFTVLQIVGDSVKLVDTLTSEKPEVSYTFPAEGNYLLYVTAAANGLTYSSPRIAASVVMPGLELDQLKYNVNSDGKTCTLTGYTGSVGLAKLPNTMDKYTVTAIADYAFAGNTKLEGTLTLPAGLTSIGKAAFSNCAAITGTLTIPGSVTFIDESAFLNCSGLKEVILPDNLTTLNVASAFANCGDLTYRCTPGSKTELLLAEQGIIEMAMPASKHPYTYSDTVWLGKANTTGLLIRFGQLELAPNDELVLLDEGGNTLHRLTNASDLTQEYFAKGNRVTFRLRSTTNANKPSASKHGFTVSGIRQCTSDEVVIAQPSSVPGKLNIGEDLTGTVTIAGAALENVEFLYTLERKENNAFIKEEGPVHSNSNVYRFTPGQPGEYRVVVLALLTVGESGSDAKMIYNYVVSDKDMFEFAPRGDGTLTLTKCKQRSGQLTIPTEHEGKKVTAIGPFAFEECGFSGTIVIPEGITTIETCAFINNKYENCTLKLPSTLTTLGSSAFAVKDGSEHSLKGELTIPKSVKTISENCFANNHDLKILDIKEGVTTLGRGAFSNCSSLMVVNLPDSINQIGDGAFNNCDTADFYGPRFGTYAFEWLMLNGFDSSKIHH